MSVALILAGHGSHISPNTAGVVWRYVDALRRRGIADEITAAFWKEMPHYHQVMDSVTADTVVIVPVFTAAGYFSQQVIPAEMGLPLSWIPNPHPASPEFGGGVVPATEGVSAKVRSIGGERTIHYTRTLGEHSAVFDVVQQRIREAISSARLDSTRTAVAIIGHGTLRSATTRATTRQQVAAIRSLGLVGDVLDAYLDDEPDIPSIYKRTSAEDIIAVPFFLAPGSHTT
ncbi:MAG: hypothetical protein L0Z53_24200, partial [Acidobacteriales bacterium]|nr:hypothetical protein [Terriglobales bacterium]